MEYIELTTEEQIRAKEHILNGEISVLETLKHARNFKKLRNEELKLKDELRKKLTLITSKIKQADIELPKTKIPIASEKKPAQSIKKRKDLEFEIDVIKQKLALLGSRENF